MILKVEEATIFGGRKIFNPCACNVSVMEKPGKMCEKHLRKSDILNRDTGN